MPEDQVVRLLQEISDSQHQQLELAQENSRRYAESVSSHERMLEEIRDLQNQQVELARENNLRYAGVVTIHEKDQRRAKKVQIAFFILVLVILGLLLYAQWFLDGNPKPSWMK